MTGLVRLLVLCMCVGIGLLLGLTLLTLPMPSVNLAAHVGTELNASGVAHPVTAVLLNFRGYDTLLEVAVLTAALLGVLVTNARERPLPLPPSRSAPSVLPALARLLAPVIVLVAGYLLWAGAHKPGGAFQAGAVLAAGSVLLNLAGLLPRWSAPGRLLRFGLVCGLLIFLAVTGMLLTQGSLLQYPPRFAGALILLIETGLTLSIGLVLAGLILWLPNEREEGEA